MSYPSDTPRWRRYLRFWRRDVQRDIDEELRFHFDARVEELTAQGMSAPDAAAAANSEFGDVGEVRRGLREIDDRIARRHTRRESFAGWKDDFAYAARALRRTPIVAATIVVTLALGLGMSSVMFSLIDTLYFRAPIGVVSPADLRRVWIWHNGSDGGRFASELVSYPQYAAMTKAASAAQFALYAADQKTRIGHGEGAAEANVVRATSSYFALLGVRAARGRFYTAQEDELGHGAHVAVLSDAFWRRQFAEDDDVVGKEIVLGGESFTVIGVAPKSFTGLDLNAADLWTPLATANGGWRDRKTPWWQSTRLTRFTPIIRVSSKSDRLVAEQISSAIRVFDKVERQRDSTVVQLGSIMAARGPDTRRQEVAIAARLGGVSIIVLLIACANVVNLLLARAVTRRREIAVRLALGMSKTRLVRLVLAESVLLALAAAVAAGIAAEWGGRLLRMVLLPDIHWGNGPLQLRVVWFTLAVALGAGIAAGLLPALQAMSTDLTRSLKAGFRDAGVQRSRIRSVLIATQAALSVVLLVGAVLFIRSLGNVRRLDIGFEPSRVTVASIRFENRALNNDLTIGARLQAVGDRARALPGVERVAVATMEPMQGFSSMPFYAGSDSMGSRPGFFPTFTGVTLGFFDAVGMRIRRGADFSPERGAQAAREIVVNEMMARTLWPAADPIGQCIRLAKPEAECYRVVGVVENGRRSRVTEKLAPLYYVPLDLLPAKEYPADVIVIRVAPKAGAPLSAALRQLMRESFPGGEPVIKRMADYLEPQYRPWRLGAILFTGCGALALIVSMIGIYSTVSYAVSQRTHEFGVRIALGAKVSDVLRLVLGSGLRAVTIGVVCGLVLSIASGRLVTSLLYGVSPRDPMAMGIVAVLLLAVGVVASLAPAWRASRVDPVIALRAD